MKRIMNSVGMYGLLFSSLTQSIDKYDFIYPLQGLAYFAASYTAFQYSSYIECSKNKESDRIHNEKFLKELNATPEDIDSKYRKAMLPLQQTAFGTAKNNTEEGIKNASQLSSSKQRYDDSKNAQPINFIDRINIKTPESVRYAAMITGTCFFCFGIGHVINPIIRRL